MCLALNWCCHMRLTLGFLPAAKESILFFCFPLTFHSMILSWSLLADSPCGIVVPVPAGFTWLSGEPLHNTYVLEMGFWEKLLVILPKIWDLRCHLVSRWLNSDFVKPRRETCQLSTVEAYKFPTQWSLGPSGHGSSGCLFLIGNS